MNGYYSKQPRFWRGLSLAVGLLGVLLLPFGAIAQDTSAQNGTQEKVEERSKQRRSRRNNRRARRQTQPLSWARIDYLLNSVELIPREAVRRAARVADVMGIGDALVTYKDANAELRFSDGSEAYVGEQATFRFTPNTRNFELGNGTVLLLIPPGRGRTTIQTPNAVTGIQGSALFVRYIPEEDRTIVGALTNNPDGPMTLFNEDGTQQQSLYANQVGVVEDGRITEIYELDGQTFWDTNGLAENFDYTEDAGSADELDGVRQEIRDALEEQESFDDQSNIVENPDKFSRPESDAQASVGESSEETSTEDTDEVATEEAAAEEPAAEEPAAEEESVAAASDSQDAADSSGEDGVSTAVSAGESTVADAEPAVSEETEVSEEAVADPDIQYEGSPAESFHNQDKPSTTANSGGIQPPSEALTEAEDEDEDETAVEEVGDRPTADSQQPADDAPTAETPASSDRPAAAQDRPATEDSLPVTNEPVDEELVIDDPTTLPGVPDSEETEVLAPPAVAGGDGPSAPIVQPNLPTEGINPLPPSALTDGEEMEDEEEMAAEEDGEPIEDAPIEDAIDSEDSVGDEDPVDAEDEAPVDGTDGVEGVDNATTDPVDQDQTEDEAAVDSVDSEASDETVAPAETPDGFENGPVVDEMDIEGSTDVEEVEEVEVAEPADADSVGVDTSTNVEDVVEEGLIIDEPDATLDNPEDAEVVPLPDAADAIDGEPVEVNDGVDAELVVPSEPLVEDDVPEPLEDEAETPLVPEDELVEPIDEAVDTDLSGDDPVDSDVPVISDEGVAESGDLTEETIEPELSPEVEVADPEAVEVEAPEQLEVEAVEPVEVEPVEVEVEAPEQIEVEALEPAPVEVEASEPLEVVEPEAVELEAVEAGVPEPIESEVFAPEFEVGAPEVVEDEAFAPELEVEEPGAVEVFEETPIEDVPGDEVPSEALVEETPFVETLEELAPVQLEEAVPFPVEQVDDFSTTGGVMMDEDGTQMNMEDMDMEGANAEAVVETPELR